MNATSPASMVRWLPALNGAGEEIPSFAACEISSVSAEGVVTLIKPTADSLAPERVAFNGPTPIATSGYGSCTKDFPAVAKVTGAPAAKDKIGTVASQWHLADIGENFIPWAAPSGGLAMVMPCRKPGPCRTEIDTLLVTFESSNCAFLNGMEFEIERYTSGVPAGCCAYRLLNFDPKTKSPGCTCPTVDPVFLMNYNFTYLFCAGSGHRATLQAAGGSTDACGGLDSSPIYFPGNTMIQWNTDNMDWEDDVLLDEEIDRTSLSLFCCGTAPVGGYYLNLRATVTIPP